jgi:hypothetical protein
MTANEKILMSLRTAMTHLENSIQSFNKKDERSFADSLWHVAAELEFALFLFSIKFQDESSVSKLKPNPELKKVETGSLLLAAQKLLNETEECLADEKLQESYKKAHMARHYLLKVQEDLAKKKREALKKK